MSHPSTFCLDTRCPGNWTHRLKFSILVRVISGVGLQKCQLAVLCWVIPGLYFSVLARSAVDTQANFNLSVFYYIGETFKPNMVPSRMWALNLMP